MKQYVLLCLLAFSYGVNAAPCSETEEYKNRILPEMKEISKLDKQGEVDFDAALKNFQKASKMDDKQLMAYAAKVATKPELSKFQQERQNLALKSISLITSEDCAAIKDVNKKLKSTILLQWAGVLAAVQADTQVYLVKGVAGPDVNAVTDSGKKVVLHANGTWSEAKQK